MDFLDSCRVGVGNFFWAYADVGTVLLVQVGDPVEPVTYYVPVAELDVCELGVPWSWDVAERSVVGTLETLWV